LVNVLVISEERIGWWDSSGEKLGREDEWGVKSGFRGGNGIFFSGLGT
jgi:hypothetical protein